jgi:hypothetical protein
MKRAIAGEELLQEPPAPQHSLNETIASLLCAKDGDDYKPECLSRTCDSCSSGMIELTPEEVEHCQHIQGNLRCYKYISQGMSENRKTGKVEETKKFDYVEETKTGQQLCDHLNGKIPNYPACHLSVFPEHQYRANHNQQAHD